VQTLAPALPLTLALTLTHRHSVPTDQANLEKNQTKLRSKLEAYDVILGKHKFLAGDEVTLADLFHLPYGSLVSKVSGSVVIAASAARGGRARARIALTDSQTGVAPALTDGSLPNVQRWWAALQALPAWAKVREGGFMF
jgi:glutathione S-transferase